MLLADRVQLPTPLGDCFDWRDTPSWRSPFLPGRSKSNDWSKWRYKDLTSLPQVWTCLKGYPCFRTFHKIGCSLCDCMTAQPLNHASFFSSWTSEHSLIILLHADLQPESVLRKPRYNWVIVSAGRQEGRRERREGESKERCKDGTEKIKLSRFEDHMTVNSKPSTKQLLELITEFSEFAGCEN